MSASEMLTTPEESLFDVLAARFATHHLPEAAATLETLDAEAVAEYLESLDSPVAGRLLQNMLPSHAARVLTTLSAAAVASVLPVVSAPRAAEIVGWLDPPEREALLEQAGGRCAREIRELLSYPAGTAGALMDSRVIAVRESATAGEALDLLREAPRSLHQLHIVDEGHHFTGVLPVQALALLDRDDPIAPHLERTQVTIPAMADNEEIVALQTRTGLPSLAVVDTEGVLVGVLRHRALVTAAEDEALAELQKMVGVSPDERALSPVGFAVRKRLPWLQINLATAFLAAAVVGLFESTIARITSLAVLLPVVAGQSGNSGSQALAVTMRGLALREIRGAHFFRLARKELLVGVLNGFAVALVTALGVYVWSRKIMLAAVIATAMVVSMAAAGLSGAAIPVVLKSFGQDPAQSSSIILTTITDVIGFMSFLGLATILANHLV